MNVYAKIILKIIEDQENIIGPIALEQARKVSGLKIDWMKKEVTIEGNTTQIMENLINQFKLLFGQASIEVCKEAVGKFKGQVAEDQLPVNLRQ